MGKILLFYKYIDISDTHAIRKWQHELCTKLGLTGRILIAQEGINGTVGGTDDSIKLYQQAMLTHQLFSNIDFKESEGGSDSFPRLRVAIRPEIVHLGLDIQKISAKNGGTHLTPQQTHALLQKKSEDLIILDGRNYYEARIGTFQNAITPNIENFRELPAFIDQNLDQFKDKQVLMFCTGGIRCERASAYLKSKNIAQEVYQLSGGIERYVKEYPDGFFRGKNYVFDGRVAVRINQDILAHCDICSISCDDYTNCLNAECNKQYIACQSCLVNLNNCCSQLCMYLVQENKVVVRKITKKVDESSCTTIQL